MEKLVFTLIVACNDLHRLPTGRDKPFFKTAEGWVGVRMPTKYVKQVDENFIKDGNSTKYDLESGRDMDAAKGGILASGYFQLTHNLPAKMLPWSGGLARWATALLHNVIIAALAL